MSYDIYLETEKCPHCGQTPPEPDLPNPTYNLTPIFDLALTGAPVLPNADVGEVSVVLFNTKTDRPRGLRLLNGRKAADTLPEIEAAIRRMLDMDLREKFLALEPANKWGSFGGAFEVMTTLYETAKQYPTYTWRVQ